MYPTPLPQPPAGGPGSLELASSDSEARSTLPGAACSMSKEPFGTIQQVSQPTTAPKNNFDPGEKTMRESRVSVPWRHAKRPAAGLLGSLHASRYTHPQTHPLGHFSKKTLSAKRPRVNPVSLVWCLMQERSSMARFVRGAAPSHTAARGPSGCRTRSIVRSETLASSQLSAQAQLHHGICHLVSSLSRGCPSAGTSHPPRTCIEPTLQKDTSPTRLS